MFILSSSLSQFMWQIIIFIMTEQSNISYKMVSIQFLIQYFSFLVSLSGMNYSYNSRYSTNELKVKQSDQPLDTVSCIVWNPYFNDPCFMTAGWDAVARLYKINTSNSQIQKLWEIFLHHPILTIDFNQNNIMFAGLASGHIVAVDMANSNIASFGMHDAPLAGVFWIKEKGILMSLGFDRFIKFWSLDQPNKVQAEFCLPIKTVSCSFDYPYLLIGSCQSTISIISIKNLPNINIPKNENNYEKINLQKYSKINCSKILASGKKGMIGTVDGRCSSFNFREDSYDGFKVSDPVVNRSQKKNQIKSLYGQVNCLEIGSYDYETFGMIGGSEDLCSYNLVKKVKVKTIVSLSSSIGASTAVKLSPTLDYVIYATGSDWLKGLSQLQSMKKPKICGMKITSSDLKELTVKN